jgi:hypothetical protein
MTMNKFWDFLRRRRKYMLLYLERKKQTGRRVAAKSSGSILRPDQDSQRDQIAIISIKTKKSHAG